MKKDKPPVVKKAKSQDFRTNQGRERWIVESTVDKIFAVGDLPKLPSFSQRKSFDLLQYYSKEETARSVDLAKLLRAKKIKFTRIIDGEVIAETFDPMEMLRL